MERCHQEGESGVSEFYLVLVQEHMELMVMNTTGLNERT
jgi:hypothetical protein